MSTTTTVLRSAGCAFVVGRVRTHAAWVRRQEEAASVAQDMRTDSTGRIRGDILPSATDGTSVAMSAGEEGPYAALFALATRGDYVTGDGTVVAIAMARNGRRVGKREANDTSAATSTVRKGHRSMTGAERKAVADQRKREARAAEAGVHPAQVKREREAWLAKRAERNGAESAALVARAIATSATSWDVDH